MKERWPASRCSEIVAVPLQEDLVAPARGPLHLLLVAVALVLLVASVNVANLVLVRATGRDPGVRDPLRAGIGPRPAGPSDAGREPAARRTRAARSGLMLAGNGVIVLRGSAATRCRDSARSDFDPDRAGIRALTTVATAVGCGVVPAVRLARTAPVEALRQQSRSATGTRGPGLASQRSRHRRSSRWR